MLLQVTILLASLHPLHSFHSLQPPRTLMRPPTTAKNILVPPPSPPFRRRHAIFPVARAFAEDETKPSILNKLWPNTLCKFWGMHAAALASACPP